MDKKIYRFNNGLTFFDENMKKKIAEEKSDL